MPTRQCALCLQVGNLQKSHLLPASLYRKARTPVLPNPNPMVVTARASVQSSLQVADYLLCRDCEQLFSSKGEQYVMTQVFDGRRFPLLDTLRSTTGQKMGSEFVAYSQRTTPNVDRNKLGYFALSIFWRASVHVWKRRGEAPITIDVGKSYNESLRQFLVGQAGFPSNVVVYVMACTDGTSQECFFAPSLGFKGNYHTYTFQAKGLLFFMTVGKLIPPELINFCTVSGPERWIYVRDCQQKVSQAFYRLMRNQKI